MSETAFERFEFFVRGRVQGVAFRAHTRNTAVELDLAGFVENLDDGRVHGEVFGPETALAEFRRFLDQGPRWARVDHVEWASRSDDGEADLTRPFTIRR